MKIIILGKNGQLGNELVMSAARTGAEVIGFSHQELDILDTQAIRSAIVSLRPDVIINATAYHQPLECELHPDTAFSINAIAVLHMAKICEELNVQFMTYSTDYVFDGKKGHPYEEGDAPAPLQVYGASKFAGELLAQEYNPRSLIIRTCGVYGGKEGSRSKKGNFVLTIRKQIEEKSTLEVSSEQIVSPTYAHDLADASMKLLEKHAEGGIYHLVNSGACSWAEMAKEIAVVMKSSCRITPVDRSGTSGGINRPLYSVLANNRAQALGITLPDWKDALKRYLDSFI